MKEIQRPNSIGYEILRFADDECTILHCEDRPAIELYLQSGERYCEMWYFDDKPFRRNDEPTFVSYHKNGFLEQKQWRNENGELHRESGPARLCYDIDGVLHIQGWYQNDKCTKEIVNSR